MQVFISGRRRRKQFLIPIFWAVFVLIVTSVDANSQTLPMRHYTVDDGLINNEVYSSLQDHRGYFWFGTYNGISRFDGKSFETFNEENSGLGGVIITSLVEDSKQRIWAGFTGGVAVLEGEQFINFDETNGLLGTDIVDLWADPAGGVWAVAGVKGVNYIKDKKIKPYLVEGLLAANYAVITGTPERTIFVASKKGIYQWKPDLPEFQLIETSQIKVTGITYDDQTKTLFIIDEGALYKLEKGVVVQIAKSPLKDPLINLTIGRNQSIWLASEQEIWEYHPKKQVVLSKAELADPSISSVFEDREGNLWLSRWGGLSMIVDDKILNYQEGLSGKIATSLLKVGDQFFIGGEWGISRLTKDGSLQPWAESSYVNSVAEYQGRILAATEKALYIYDLKGNIVGTIEKETTTLLKDRQNKLWVGSYEGVFSFSDNQLYLETNSDKGLGSNNVWGLYEDSKGTLWVATENGGAFFQEGKWTYFNEKDGLPHESVWIFREHPDWGVLLGTSRGLAVWKEGKFEPFLPDITEPISQLGVDQYRKLWVGTESGLYRYNLNKERDLTLNKAQGLSASAPYHNSLLFDEGFIYSGTYGGLSRIDLSIREEKSISPLLEIKQLEVNHEIKAKDAFLTPLTYKENNITFEYDAIYAYQPRSLTYSSLLEGYDQTWSSKSSLNKSIYTNLPHGKYRFHVRAYAEDEKRSEAKTFSFEILPPFWLTWPFIAIVTVLLLLVLSVMTRSIVIWSLRKSELERQRINSLYEKQLQLDKLKDDFLANTSHELRTPLNSIIGLGESILDGVNGPVTPAQEKNLGLIVQSGRRLSNLVNDILDYSKLLHHELPLKLEPVDIRVATDVVFMLSKSLIGNKEIQLRNYIPKDTPLVLADENRLQQILVNLVGNAIKFTHQGEVSFSSEIRENTILISVSDSGVGIPEDKLSTIFQSFEQADSSIEREFGGTGLGLTITQKLVNLHSGQLMVESEVGKGSRFSFSLELSGEERSSELQKGIGDAGSTVQVFDDLEVSSEISPANTDPMSVENEMLSLQTPSNQVNSEAQFPGAKILAVDDEYANLEVLKSQLHSEGYEILTSQNGSEALEIIEKEHPDLILLDLMMPRMNGYDVCKKIRKQYGSSTMPVIIVTAKNQLTDMVQGFDTGANDYMVKPLQKRELLSRIRAHLQIRDATNNMIENIRLKTEIEERARSESSIKKMNEDLAAINKELKDTEAQLIQAGKLSALGELATGIAHELNQPLLYIRSHAQMQLMDGIEKQDWGAFEKTLKIVESGTDRMMTIIEHLQAFAHKPSNEFTPLKIEEVVENSLILMNEYLARFDIRLGKAFAPDLRPVLGESSQLEQVFINIFQNAKDALMEQQSPHLSLKAEMGNGEDQSKIIIKVRDNGCGMDSELMAKIFEPFVTSKDAGKGTGLGLSICYNIIRNHNGEIFVSSSPGKGSSFEIHLPVAPA